VLCLLTCVPLSQENSVDGQKLTPTLGSPNATKTNPPKKKQSSRMTGWIKGCSVCCVCATVAAASKTNDSKNLCLCVVFVLPVLLPQKQPTQKKDGLSGWRDGFRVVVNRWMTGWMNWPSGWMDDCTDLREASLFGFRICRHSSFTICNNANCTFNNTYSTYNLLFQPIQIHLQTIFTHFSHYNYCFLVSWILDYLLLIIFYDHILFILVLKTQ